MKHRLLGAVSTIALGAAYGSFTSGAARAGLVCSPGSSSTVGSYTCTETVTAPAGPLLTSNVLALDQWMSLADAGYTQTLSKVSYSLGATLNGFAEVTNTDTITVNGSFIAGLTFTATNGPGAPSNFLSPGRVYRTTVFGPAITLAAGASTPYTFGAGGLTGSKTVSGTLSGFVGSGTFSAIVAVALRANGYGFVSSPAGNFASSITISSVAPTIQLTYDFTTSVSTPEPASLALLGVGLAGAGVVRRRRKT